MSCRISVPLNTTPPLISWKITPLPGNTSTPKRVPVKRPGVTSGKARERGGSNVSVDAEVISGGYIHGGAWKFVNPFEFSTFLHGYDLKHLQVFTEVLQVGKENLILKNGAGGRGGMSSNTTSV